MERVPYQFIVCWLLLRVYSLLTHGDGILKYTVSYPHESEGSLRCLRGNQLI